MPDRSVIATAAHPNIGKISEEEYFRLYRESLADPNRFWGEHGRRVDWIKPYTKVMNASFERRRVDPLVRGRHAQRLL